MKKKIDLVKWRVKVMAKVFENFILGAGKVPEWFNEEANKGKVKQVYDEDGDLKETHIISGTKVYVAKEGDTIIKTNYGLVVLEQKEAKKFGVQKRDEKPAKSDKEQETEE